jgi:hypothetical protein
VCAHELTSNGLQDIDDSKNGSVHNSLQAVGEVAAAAGGGG